MGISLGICMGMSLPAIGSGGGDTTAPEITNLSAVSNTISFDMSEPGTTWMLRNTSATLITGAAAKAGAETSWTVEEGANVEAIDESGWPDGTYYLHFAGEDAAGNLPDFAIPVEWTKTTPFTLYSRVLNPAAASSGLRYTFTANTIFNLATAKTAGYWLGGYAYFDGTAWTGAILSAANSASGTGYAYIDGNKAGWRAEGAAEATTVALSNPGSVGWYFVTGHLIIKEAADANPRRIFNFWRNGTQATPFSNATANEAGLIALNRFGFGHLADNTPSSYNDFEYCGLCWGTGDPALMHAWVYNSGTLRDVRDYNFAGDANGCSLGGFWPAGRNTGAAFDVNDTQLDDFVDALDTPVLVGTMEWAVLTAPIGD
jgi:hypothetical protein